MCLHCTKSIYSIYNPYQHTNFNPAHAVSRVFIDTIQKMDFVFSNESACNC